MSQREKFLLAKASYSGWIGGHCKYQEGFRTYPSDYEALYRLVETFLMDSVSNTNSYDMTNMNNKNRFFFFLVHRHRSKEDERLPDVATSRPLARDNKRQKLQGVSHESNKKK